MGHVSLWGVCATTLVDIVASAIQPARAALVPTPFLDCVVALGETLSESDPRNPTAQTPAPQKVWFTEGTGFFYGFLAENDPDQARRKYETYLVTARHVVAAHLEQGAADIFFRVNSKDPAKAEGFALPAHPAPGESGWFFAPASKDIAAIQVNFQFLQDRGLQVAFFPNDTVVAKRSKLKELGVSAGDGVFVLGFPMNLAGAQRNYVVVRQGGIARISSLLDGTSDTFLLDSFVFPGNSGGPVVLRPEVVSIAGTKSQANAYLVGAVIAYEAYSEVAVSVQTKQPRVVFQENSGLADVLPVDYVEDAINQWRVTRSAAAPATPSQTTR
jgi:hypothetical protein